nr:hypothetical protein BDDEJBFL_00168 [Agrobacterium fabrum]
MLPLAGRFEKAGRKAVEADLILFPPVVLDPVDALGPGPGVHLRALFLVFEQRHAVAAGCLNQIEVEPYHLPRAERRVAVEPLVQQAGKLVTVAMDDAPLAKKAA